MIDLILYIACIFLIIEAVISIKKSQDRRLISMFGRVVRIIIAIMFALYIRGLI